MDGRLFDLHLALDEIRAGVEEVLASPRDAGVLEMIVCRPKIGKREVVENGTLDCSVGLVGDNWSKRGSSRTPDFSAHPEMQLNLMNYRFAELIAGRRERVPLAGDQLFVDFDLSAANVPPGTRLSVGEALIEVTSVPHLGCKKFVERFGIEAMKFANSEFGRRHNLRGINAKVIRGGAVAVGDIIERKLENSLKIGRFSMKRFGKNVVRSVGLLAFLFAVAAVSQASAQNMSGTVVTKEVKFAKGTHSSTVKGSAKYGMSYVYTLGAKAGQTMNVNVKAKSRELTFSVMGPDDETVADAFGVTEYSGALPKSGKYTVVVVMNDQNASPMPFTMNVTIK